MAMRYTPTAAMEPLALNGQFLRTVPAPKLESTASIRIHCTEAGMWVVPAETVQNMDVLDAPTGTYLRHVSAGTTHSAANAATYLNEAV